ncbi:NUDIX domain-containing protein [Agilicoccus flavus]|uniref:NUDIX domain-containing protein n=1 Tax=Agilicoccus flavus TaxID=2775968 RepID=UPI001CF61DA0|nr:NUDIX domain-containing protein [Agilicoccus flavus]
MARTSAGLLPFRHTPEGIEVFVAHMGGPFWARRTRAWSIVKGEFDPATEDGAAAAAREFAEETGAPAPPAPWLDLGTIRQSGGKVVHAFAVEAPQVAFVASNEIDIEWPPRSGRTMRVPEVDRADWLGLEAARDVLVAAQAELLDRLADLAAG